MTRKKFTPSPAKIETANSLANAPGRDDKAITLAVSALIIKQNPRSDLGDLTELRDSISDRGILNPLLVVQTPDGWELIGGHRRLACAKELGMIDVPCRIVTTDEPEVVKLIDNILRDDLSPTDVCLGLKKLLPAFSGNQSALARAISKTPSYVSRAVKAADLIEAGLCARAQSPLTLRALFDLASTEDPVAVLNAAAEGTGTAIRDAKESAAPTGKPPRKPSGPLPGGRAVANAIQFRERNHGNSFSLRVHFDAEKTPPATKAEIIRKLEDVLSRLRN